MRSVLLLEIAPSEKRRKEMLRFAMRFQQFTRAGGGEGDEDTAFYRYNRLIALNEVGGNPSRFGLSLDGIPRRERGARAALAGTMLGTSTHDTKRSEDARARLGVLSELRVRLAHDAAALEPDEPGRSSRASDEYHFYQALVGDLARRGLARAHRAPEGVHAEGGARGEGAHELDQSGHGIRALRSSASSSESLRNESFVRDVADRVARLAHLGLLVGLSQALVKVASPGVPDYYQGTEIWDFSLVDPDNRRPVDYAVRMKLLSSLGENASGLLQNLADGRAKMHVIRKGLEVRKKFPALFQGGKYTPLYADGGREENILAFSLSDATRSRSRRGAPPLRAPDGRRRPWRRSARRPGPMRACLSRANTSTY